MADLIAAVDTQRIPSTLAARIIANIASQVFASPADPTSLSNVQAWISRAIPWLETIVKTSSQGASDATIATRIEARQLSQFIPSLPVLASLQSLAWSVAVQLGGPDEVDWTQRLTEVHSIATFVTPPLLHLDAIVTAQLTLAHIKGSELTSHHIGKHSATKANAILQQGTLALNAVIALDCDVTVLRNAALLLAVHAIQHNHMAAAVEMILLSYQCTHVAKVWCGIA
jgi:hypothetical protein